MHGVAAVGIWLLRQAETGAGGPGAGVAGAAIVRRHQEEREEDRKEGVSLPSSSRTISLYCHPPWQSQAESTPLIRNVACRALVSASGKWGVTADA